MILVLAEHRGGSLNRASWEAVAAAQQLAAEGPLTVAVLGATVGAAARELSAAKATEVVTVEHPALEPYTPDGYVAALQEVIAQLTPTVVVLPHTYQTRDFAPTIAARMDRALITDVIKLRVSAGEVTFARPMFQGKLTADVTPLGPSPHFVTVQIEIGRASCRERV